MTLAHELSHPFSVAFALIYTAWLRQSRREGQAVQDRAEALIALSTEQGHGAEGLSQIREGLAALQATGAEVERSQFLALLAEAYGQDAQVEEGLRTVAKALAFVGRTAERSVEAELYRVKGELILQKFKVQGSKFQR